MDSVFPFLPVAELDRTEIDGPEAIVDLLEPHGLVAEGVTQEKALAVEFHPATGGDAAHFKVTGVLDRWQLFRIRA